jgi:hypothetical protein
LPQSPIYVVTDHQLLSYSGDMAEKVGKSNLTIAAAARYRIEIVGPLDNRWSHWFGGAEITVTGPADRLPRTTIVSPAVDQVQLRGMVNKIWDLNLELISLQRLPPPTEAVGPPRRHPPREAAGQTGTGGTQ